MDLREYFIILKKHLVVLFAFGLLGAVVAAVGAPKVTGGVHFQQLFFIPAPKETAEELYRSPSYFAQERARNFTDTAVALISNSDFLADAQVNASITSRKVAPQLIRLTAQAAEAQTAREAIDKTVVVFNQKMASLEEDGQALTIKPVESQPREVFVGPTKGVATTAGAFLGVTFALIVIGLKVYFRL